MNDSDMHHTTYCPANARKIESYLESQVISYVEGLTEEGQLKQIRITTTRGPIIIQHGEAGLEMLIGHIAPHALQ